MDRSEHERFLFLLEFGILVIGFGLKNGSFVAFIGVSFVILFEARVLGQSYEHIGLNNVHHLIIAISIDNYVAFGAFNFDMFPILAASEAFLLIEVIWSE